MKSSKEDGLNDTETAQLHRHRNNISMYLYETITLISRLTETAQKRKPQINII